MRTFIAIELPPAFYTHLATVQRQLQAMVLRSPGGDCFNWVAAEKVHLTLRFLGETHVQQVAQIAHYLTVLAQRLPPFELAGAGVGVFPNFRRPNVLWLGLRGDLPTLRQMQQQIETFVQQAGFAAESRAFSPHLTLARARRNATPATLEHAGQAIQGISENASTAKQVPIAPPFRVTQIVHLHSELRPDGAHYTTLGSYQLRNEGK